MQPPPPQHHTTPAAAPHSRLGRPVVCDRRHAEQVAESAQALQSAIRRNKEDKGPTGARARTLMLQQNPVYSATENRAARRNAAQHGSPNRRPEYYCVSLRPCLGQAARQRESALRRNAPAAIGRTACVSTPAQTARRSALARRARVCVGARRALGRAAAAKVRTAVRCLPHFLEREAKASPRPISASEIGRDLGGRDRAPRSCASPKLVPAAPPALAPQSAYTASAGERACAPL